MFLLRSVRFVQEIYNLQARIQTKGVLYISQGHEILERLRSRLERQKTFFGLKPIKADNFKM